MTAPRRSATPKATTQHRTVRYRWAVCAALLTVAVVVSGGLFAPADATTRWQSGVYTSTCGKSAVKTFGSWRHARVERTSGYISTGTWAQLAKFAGLGRCLSQDGLPMTLSVAMLPGSGGDLADGAKGAYNSYWAAFGRNAVRYGYSHATLRIGWEMNGAWFKWSATKDPVHWKAYWRQIVRTLRKVHGQHFTYEWSPGLGENSTGFQAAKAYPGNAYVTYVGASVYDVWYGSPSASPAKRWASLVREPYGLGWLARFAKTHHKRIGISEWGLASSSSFGGHGDGDDAYFITHFYAWMKRSNVAYEVYFNRQHQGNDHRLAVGAQTNATFTKAAAAYRRTFGGV